MTKGLRLPQVSAIGKIIGEHFYWSALDVDLTLDMIDHPEKYPRKFR